MSALPAVCGGWISRLLLGCVTSAFVLGTVLTGFAAESAGPAAAVTVIGARIAMLPLLVWALRRATG